MEGVRFFSRGVEALEVPLRVGLASVCENGFRLYSDGLDFDEYMFCKEGGIYYEDLCFIGRDDYEACERLSELNWVNHHKFFITKETHEELLKKGL